MYFLLSLITTGIIGYFLPQWMYDITWPDLIECLNPDTTSAKVSEFINKLGITEKNAVEVATEKVITLTVIILAIFIGMLIITKIIKKAVNKNK